MSEPINITDAAYSHAVKTLTRHWHNDPKLSFWGPPTEDDFEEMVGAVIAGLMMIHFEDELADAEKGATDE